jgi:integrase
MVTDLVALSAKPAQKPYKLTERDGFYLLVNPNGSRWWRFKYRVDGREKGLSFGVYPEVPLSLARKRRDEAWQLGASGVDPTDNRKADRIARNDSFEAIAREWLALQAKLDKKNNRAALAPVTLANAQWMLERFIFLYPGSRPVSKITAPELLKVLKRIEARGTHETFDRTKQLRGQIFRYAIATGRADRGGLLRAIDGYRGRVKCFTDLALRLAPLVFVRPGELRKAEWSEFDLERAEWRVSATRMKMGEEHVVPLSQQALAILKELQPLTGGGRYVFPSLRTTARPMSNNAINAALRRMGYSGEEMTGHGFRALASTCLNEQGWHPDLMDLQLAHAERNKVRAAYNCAQRPPERRNIVQAWADYLDGLRSDHQSALANPTAMEQGVAA